MSTLGNSVQSKSCSQMDSLYAAARQRLLETLIDADEQIRTLEELTSRVCRGSGGSAIVFGARESGRTAVVDKAIEKYTGAASPVEVSSLCLARPGSDASALQELVDNESSSNPRILVVDHADDLVCKTKQAVLYRLLDRTKTRPWLVILIVTRQDMVSSLEKRVRSRLSNTRVLTGGWKTMKEWREGWRQLLRAGDDGDDAKENLSNKGRSRKESEKTRDEEKKKKSRSASRGRKVKKEEKKEEEEEAMEVDQPSHSPPSPALVSRWNSFVDSFTAHVTADVYLQKLYDHGGTWSTLKKATDAWLVFVGEGWKEERAARAAAKENSADGEMEVDGEEEDEFPPLDFCVAEWKAAVAMTVPLGSQLLPIIKSLSLRSLGVLACVARRARCHPASSGFGYSRIAVDFRHLCNTTDKRLLPKYDLITYKELDELCFLGILASSGPSGETDSNRVVSPNMSLPSLVECMQEAIGRSTAMWDWYTSQPTN